MTTPPKTFLNANHSASDSAATTQVEVSHLLSNFDIRLQVTRWLYFVECPQYSIRLETVGYLCDRRTFV